MLLADETLADRSPNLDPKDETCTLRNRAEYGSCFASSFMMLSVSGMPTIQSPAYAFLPFTVVVRKQDAYNQTIVTDSFSVVQAQILMNGRHLFSSSAVPTASLQSGKALLSITVKPTFSTIIPADRIAVVEGQLSIIIKGIDSQALNVNIMSSSVLPVIIASNSSACPSGFILFVDDSGSGTCSICGAGTYSLLPLVGADSSRPSCLNCPANAVCSGGNNVEFLIGIWTVLDGIYRLVGCPRGHQLVTSRDQAFQVCSPCQQNQYIINSNQSNFTCQNCPVGAMCDGSVLQGAISGSVWTPDLNLGQYILTSCPPGYVLVNTFGNGIFSYINQECQLCPASYYCEGRATTGAIPCAEGTFAFPGANSSSGCISSVFVLVSVSIALNAVDFTAQKQQSFTEALALATGQKVGSVLIKNISPYRRSVPSLLRIDSQIATRDSHAAEIVCNTLDITVLNDQVANFGLPPCNLISIAVDQEDSRGNADTEWIVVGLLLGLMGLILVMFFFLYCRNNSESEAEKLLKREMSALRVQLGITKKDGFLLSSEKADWWRKQREVNLIQKSYLEAAAQLGLMQDFDANQFDAFCLCLQCEVSSKIRKETVTAYDKMCEWLLAICKDLLRPGSLKDGNTLLCRMPLERRFYYFVKNVSKLRVWGDDENYLFDRLKKVAQEFLTEMSKLCHQRFEELSNELDGPALINLPSFPCGTESPEQVRRQDHQMV